MLLTIIGCEKKMNRQVYKKQTTRDTTSEMTLPKIELQLDSLQFRNRVYVDEEGNHVYGRISIEGNNGIGILKATNGCTIEVVLDKGRQNKLLATDQEGFTYKLYLK
jgi:hypothetical protein